MKMAGAMRGIAVVLALVVSCSYFLQAAANSTIENSSYAPILVNGQRVTEGQVVTISIEAGKSSGSVNLTHSRNVTNIEIRNSREYFVVPNQSGGTGIVYGRVVRTLDLVEGKRIESSF